MDEEPVRERLAISWNGWGSGGVRLEKNGKRDERDEVRGFLVSSVEGLGMEDDGR